MSRYIDADALIGTVKNEKYDCYEEWDAIDRTINLIKYAPTIDAVEAVRCQDCKYWVYNFNGCARNPCTEPWYATDYCNYGERKESE